MDYSCAVEIAARQFRNTKIFEKAFESVARRTKGKGKQEHDNTPKRFYKKLCGILKISFFLNYSFTRLSGPSTRRVYASFYYVDNKFHSIQTEHRTFPRVKKIYRAYIQITTTCSVLISLFFFFLFIPINRLEFRLNTE